MATYYLPKIGKTVDLEQAVGGEMRMTIHERGLWSVLGLPSLGLVAFLMFTSLYWKMNLKKQ